MAVPTTPNRAPPERDAQHTRDAEQTTPTNIPQAKRPRSAVAAPQRARLPGREAAIDNNNTARSYLGTQLDNISRRFAIQKDVLTKLGNSLDTLVTSYGGDQQREHQRQAKEIVGMVLEHLNNTVFASANIPLPQTTKSAPAHPENPAQQTQKSVSWANIARAGQPSATRDNRPTSKNTRPTAAPPTGKRDDIRILIAIEQGAPRHDPYILRAEICKTLGLELAHIPGLTPTKSGWALEPSTKTVRDSLMEPEKKILIGRILSARDITLPEQWYTYAVQHVPYSFPDSINKGFYIDTKDIIVDEVRAQTGNTPVDCRPSRHGPNPQTGKGTWMVSFLEPVKKFSLFNQSAMSSLTEKKPKIEIHNPGCQGYCNPYKCRRIARCNACGDKCSDHENPHDKCTKPARCANCYGPHAAGATNCPAAPYRYKGVTQRLSQNELKKIRRAGIKLYHSTNKITPATSQSSPLSGSTTPTQNNSSPALQLTPPPLSQQPAPAASTSDHSDGSPPAHTPKEVIMVDSPQSSQPATVTQAPDRNKRSSRIEKRKSRTHCEYNEAQVARQLFGDLDDPENTSL